MTEKTYRKLFFVLAIIVFLLSFYSKSGTVIFFAGMNALLTYWIFIYEEHDD
jgi:hypothetical protein